MHVGFARRLGVVAIALASLVSANAYADEPTKKQCIEADALAQKQLKEGKLLSAQVSLDLCNQPTCPGAVRDDCTQRLDVLMKRLPTLVFEAHAPNGADVSVVRVFSDGQPLAEKLDGTAIAVDPGEHTFRFESPRFQPVTIKLVIREGDHARREPVKFTRLVATPAVEIVTPPKIAEPKQSPPPITTHPLRAVGIATAGAGVLGVTLGVVFALRAQSRLEASGVDPDGAGCNAQDVCGEQGKALRSDANIASTVSTVGFVGGGLLVATGVGLIIFGPTTTTPSTASARITPMVGAGGGGMILSGTF